MSMTAIIIRNALRLLRIIHVRRLPVIPSMLLRRIMVTMIVTLCRSLVVLTCIIIVMMIVMCVCV